MAEHDTLIFGPTQPTINELRGIRYTDTGGDGTGAGGVIDQTPVVEEPPEYVEPNGDEPWAKYLENVPDVIRKDIVTGFREIDSQNNQRYEKVKAFEPLAGLAEPEVLQQAHQFAEQLFAPIPLTASAEEKAQIAQWRNNFLDTYQSQLVSAGLRPDAAAEAAASAAAAVAAEAREFETPEQTRIRELEEQIAEVRAGVGTLGQLTVQQREAQQYQQDYQTFAQEWQSIVTANGELTEKEFKLMSIIANQIGGDNPPPGTVLKAWDLFLEDYGRMPDAPAVDPAKVVPVVGSGGGANLAVPATLGPHDRAGRRKAMMDELELYQPTSSAT